MGFGVHDSQDIVADVWKKALDCDLRTVQNVKNWLSKITVNRCLEEVRKRARFKVSCAPMPELETKEDCGLAALVKNEELAQVRSALEQLDTDTLVLVTLKYHRDMTCGQIGQIMSMNESTVRGKIYEARIRLAKTIAKGEFV